MLQVLKLMSFSVVYILYPIVFINHSDELKFAGHSFHASLLRPVQL